MGLDGFAVTDHESAASFSEIGETARLWGLKIIRGMEIRSEFGDLLCLFLQEPVQERRAEGIARETRDQGGIVVLPHPAQSNLPALERVRPHVDVVEVVNGRCSAEDNLLAMRLASRWGLPGVGGSDAHFARDLGTVRTVVEGDLDDLDAVKCKLLAGESQVYGVGSGARRYFRSQLIKCYKTRSLKALLEVSRKRLRSSAFE